MYNNRCHHFAKMDVNKFDGFNLAVSVTQMEYYFPLYNLTNDMMKHKVGFTLLGVCLLKLSMFIMRNILTFWGGLPNYVKHAHAQNLSRPLNNYPFVKRI